MTDARALCIEAYRQTPDVRAVAAALGLPVIRVYLHLKTSGALLTADAARMGTKGSMSGARGEQEFKRLVPAARDMNAEVREHHPGYDFTVRDLRIDVKTYTFTRRSEGHVPGRGTRKPHWQIGTGNRNDYKQKDADVYVVFALLGEDFKNGYRLFAVPAELIGDRRYICITQGAPNLWDGFELRPEELSEFLHSLGDCPQIENKIEVVKATEQVRQVKRLVRKLDRTIKEKAA